MKKYEKGSFGYINALKKSRLIQTIVLFCIVLIVLLVGILINNYSKKNYFTIVSVLMVLPATKIAIGYIILIPFRSVDQRKYERTKSLLPENISFYTDVVLTSYEKIMNLDFLIITGNRVLGLRGKDNQDLTYINQYLNKGIKDRGFSYECMIYGNESEFYNAIEQDSKKTIEQDSKKSIEQDSKKSIEQDSKKTIEQDSEKTIEQDSEKTIPSPLVELIAYLESLMV